MVSSKLSGRRSNAGTPRVTRASVRHKCPPPRHSIQCLCHAADDTMGPGDETVVDFECSDDSYDEGDDLDHWAIFCSRGQYLSEAPQPGKNGVLYQIVWKAPATTGIFTLSADFWWPDTHSCHSEFLIKVG